MLCSSIGEVYIISLFIPDNAIGPPGSGKTLLLREIKAIADPRDEYEALVQRLTRDEKDRRVTIYNNPLSYFDNETALNTSEMDE